MESLLGVFYARRYPRSHGGRSRSGSDHQLHAATLKASDSCFEIKKMCATLVVATGTLVSVFTNKSLSAGVFAAGMAVVIAFWLADAVEYFYQRRLRAVMDGLMLKRATRCRVGRKTPLTTLTGLVEVVGPAPGAIFVEEIDNYQGPHSAVVEALRTATCFSWSGAPVTGIAPGPDGSSSVRWLVAFPYSTSRWTTSVSGGSGHRRLWRSC